METIQLVVPVPDSPILWIGLSIFSVLLAARILLGLWEKVKP